MNTSQNILKTLSKIFPTNTAYAHCDIPCGIYDPHQAQIDALTVIRMIDIMRESADHVAEAEKNGTDPLEFRQHVIRAVHVKEEHAELVKREVRVIWGDYIKAEHKEKFPEIDDLVYEIMQLSSKARQGIDRTVAMQLLDKINRFAEIFWQTKGKETKRVKAPYKPEEEIVIAVL